jgi:hypothetical protein
MATEASQKQSERRRMQRLREQWADSNRRPTDTDAAALTSGATQTTALLYHERSDLVSELAREILQSRIFMPQTFVLL